MGFTLQASGFRDGLILHTREREGLSHLAVSPQGWAYLIKDMGFLEFNLSEACKEDDGCVLAVFV
jgi:hypothetical protein